MDKTQWKINYQCHLQLTIIGDEESYQTNHILQQKIYIESFYAKPLNDQRQMKYLAIEVCCQRIVLKRDKNKCVICGSKIKLNVHHTSYDYIFQEKKKLSDLVTLCEYHHKWEHRNIKILKLFDKYMKYIYLISFLILVWDFTR